MTGPLTPDDVVREPETPVPGSEAETGTAIARLDASRATAPVLGELATVPAPNELQALAQLAVTFSATDLVPRALQDKPNDVLLVLMTARDLGLSITTALRECHPINGRVTASPKLRLAMVRSRGLGRVWADPENDDYTATWWAERADSPGTLFRSTVTWADAQRARLAGRSCKPDDHAQKCPGEGNAVCKDNWHMWPGRMLSARALGFLMDDAFGEVGTGLYDADSLGAITDAEGNAIVDVDEVDPFQGMDRPRSGKGRSARKRREAAEAGPERPDDDQLSDLRTRIKALPASALADLVARWTAVRDGQTGPFLPVDANGRPATGLLDTGAFRRARALLVSIEGDVRRGKHGEPPPAPTQPQDSPPAESGPDGADVPTEGADDPFAGCTSYDDVVAIAHGYHSEADLRAQLAAEDDPPDPGWDMSRLVGELVFVVCDRLGFEIPRDPRPDQGPPAAMADAVGDPETIATPQPGDSPAVAEARAFIANAQDPTVVVARSVQTGHDDDEHGPMADDPAVAPEGGWPPGEEPM